MNQKDDNFNQIKTELISEIKGMSGEIKGMREDMDRLFKTVEFHDQALYGNKVDKPGAMEDLRVLKKVEEKRQKHVLAVWIALVPVILERAWSYFARHGS